jgi:2-polyprenyl-3-methyl-5-hydroxy-6-metoxy-1,4-benzoquinol methylase
VCSNCNSLEVYVVNSYKHHCLICRDCSNVTHVKKNNKLLFEYIFNRKLAKKLLPPKAFMRLFSDKDDFEYEKFYDAFILETNNVTEKRLSDINQVLDTLNYFNYDITGKKILDISGGPGFVPGHLNKIALECCTTEHSELAAQAISNHFGIRAKRFDYNKDNITEIYNEKFDLILIRSSVIFCENVDDLLKNCSNILNHNGCILIESITPSLGEVLWWQTLEYKFPRIHSQETLEKYFYKTEQYNFQFKVNRGLNFFYYILVTILAIVLGFYDRTIHLYVKCGIVFVLLFYPYLIVYLEYLLYIASKYVYSILYNTPFDMQNDYWFMITNQ